jgi:hypothetical protein
MTRPSLSLSVLACAAVLVAGCGGSSPSSGVAHLSASNSSATGGSSSAPEGDRPNQQQLVAFSQCMRTHGVANFPEPSEGHLLIRGGPRGARAAGLDPGSAQFRAAREACRKLLPNGGVPSPAEQAKIQEAALKFAQCMRTHGVPSFPDPEFSHGGGGFGIRIRGRRGAAGGIDPSSPQFQAARQKCQSVLPMPPGAKGRPGGGGNLGFGFGGPKGG